MKRLNKKWLCACALACCITAGGICAAVNINRDVAQAYTVELPAGDVKDTYYVNDALTLPDSVTVTHDGNTYTLTDSVVYYPDGSAYKKASYTLEQTGSYKVVYTLATENGVLQAEKQFTVLNKNWSVGKAKTTVEFGTLTMSTGVYQNTDPYKQGLKVSLAEGDTFTYSVPIDLSKNTVNDIITINPLQTANTASARDIIVRLTDCYDESVYVDFYLWYTANNSVYARAGASNQKDNGLYKDATKQPITGSKAVFIDGTRYISYYSQWGVSLGTGGNSGSSSGFTWKYNNETKEVKIVHARSAADGDKVTELANVDIFENDLFEGFTTGEVYLSVFAEEYSDSTVDIEIGCIGGISGDGLNSADYKDEKAPTLKVNYTPTKGNAVYVAQGETVEVFDVTAKDVSGANVATSVYYNYDSTKRSQIYLKDGKFTAAQAGAYTIVYTATDAYGNMAEEKVVVNSVTTDNGKAIDFNVQELSELSAGIQTKLPEYTVSGLNGDVSVETRITAPNGETELLKTDSFVPLYIGEYTVEYRYFDAVNEYVYSYKVAGKASDAVRFLDEIAVPEYFIKGAKYSLDDIKAYSFTSENPTAAPTEFYVSIDGGEYVKSNVNEFTVDGTESVQVKYVCGSASIESEVAKIVDVGFTGTLMIKDYFQGDFTATSSYDYIRYDSNVKEGNNALKFVNAISFTNFRLDFTVPMGAYYQTFRITLTDYYDRENKTVIDLSSMDGSLCATIDGTLYKETGGFADGSIKSVYYNNSTKKIILPDSTAVSYENKFNSDLCLLEVELVGISGEAYTEIRMINNQPINSNFMDIIEPRIAINDPSGQRSLNEVVTLDAASYTDVLSPALSGVLTIEVKDPDGNKIVSNEGIALDGTCLADQKYSFTVTKYGNYRVTYKATDQSGNTYTLSKVIIVADEEAPVVTVNSKTVTISQLSIYQIDNFKITDNYSTEENLTVTVMVCDETNLSVVSVGTQFEAKYAGTYTVYVYCEDEAGNGGYATYTLIVEEKAQ